jgi:serine/threonine-protein kinase
MSLGPGTRIGAFEITGTLGAGGMGEVYRARDTKLDRDVAIKVLPEAFAQDPERLARFAREAKTLAALNHPNIGGIYGVEEAGGVPALVLELVEGPTLADRLARGAIAIDEALPIAKQIADALEAAHEQGIFHRDLKPANIKVRDDGTVKVLDFGLAKLARASGSGRRVSGGVSQSPTITSPALMTGVGVLLGTAAYMSPEQAKGREADKRCDIWAFGAVLFEMLSGTRAFDGENMTDVLGAVVRLEPKWDALPADVPPALRTLLQRCLAKDLRHRVADISVATFVLTEAASLAAPQSPPPVVVAPRASRRRSAAVIGATALSAAALAAVTMWALRPPAPTVSRFSFTIPRAHQLASTRKVLAISPDGQRLAYTGIGAVYLRPASEWESRLIARFGTTEGVHNPTFSPDGESIAFTEGNQILRIPVGGGVPVRACETPAGLSLSRGPSGIVSSGPQGVFRCVENAAMPEQLASIGASEVAYGAQILPGGQDMIFTIATASGETGQFGVDHEAWDNAKVVIQSLTSEQRRTLVTGSDGRYLPTGHLLYTVRGVVLAAPFDAARQQITGAAVPVIEGARRTPNGQSGATQYDISARGNLLYISGPAEGTGRERVLVTGDRTGNLTPLDAPPGSYQQVRASLDGARLAMDSDDGKDANIWIYERTGTSAPQRLTFGGRNRFPIWAPDGQRVAFQSDREGDRAIWVQRVDGSGLERLTTPKKGDEHIPESWARSGSLSFAVVGPRERGRASHSLWVLSIRDRVAKPFGGVQSFENIGSTFSPDGRWIAYHSISREGPFAGSSGVFVQPFPATGPIRQAPRVGRDFQPMWSADGRELFYAPIAGAGGQLAAVPIAARDGLTFGEPRTLPGTIVGGRQSGLSRGFDILPDGRFVGLVSPSNLSANASTEVRVVLGWFEELKRLVPRN